MSESESDLKDCIDKLQATFATSHKQAALKAAARLLRLGCVPTNLERFASLIDPDCTRPMDRELSVNEAQRSPKAALKDTAQIIMQLRIAAKHVEAAGLSVDDSIWAGLSEKQYGRYKRQVVNEMAAEFGVTAHTIRRHLREKTDA